MALRLKGASPNPALFHESFALATAAARAQPLVKEFVPLLISDITPSMVRTSLILFTLVFLDSTL
jgi:hypothetical protein